jgi:hypothetical protein
MHTMHMLSTSKRSAPRSASGPERGRPRGARGGAPDAHDAHVVHLEALGAVGRSRSFGKVRQVQRCA